MTPPLAAEVAEIAGGLFPGFVRIALVPIADAAPSGFEDEEEALLTPAARSRRRSEFRAGRACAHQALAALGCDHGPLLALPERRGPRWPNGVVGSISHGGAWAGAAVAYAVDAAGLGIDIEPVHPPIEPGVARLVLTEGERRVCETGPEFLAKLLFSAKEAIYKCLTPRAGGPQEFQDVEVDVDLDAGRFTARGTGAVGVGLEGRCSVAGGHIITGAFLSSAP